jgi:hypothetical protein
VIRQALVSPELADNLVENVYDLVKLLRVLGIVVIEAGDVPD